MGRIGAFLQVDRVDHAIRPANESIQDFDDFALPLTLDEQCEQASRCMNCGVAFCQSGVALGGSKHAVGCPLHNLIPETNDLLYRHRFEEAAKRVSLTNPFPEFTGRVCPAPCEVACNLGLHKKPVTINDNERALSDFAWAQGIDPLDQPSDDAPLVSVIGSGPAGLTVAWEMVRCGWRVNVYEKADRPGGLLMYGIPNMKLPKWVIDRRVNLMKQSGIQFFCNTDASERSEEIAQASDAIVLAIGARVPRDVKLEGRELEGIHFALEYLTEITSAHLDERTCSITAKDKDVVVIGGGDTGNDCVASALRQGAKSVTQVIRAKKAPDTCNKQEIWPAERNVFTQGYGQREASELFGQDPRIFSTDTIAFSGNGHVETVHTQALSYEGGRHLVEGTEDSIPAQLVLIAKGFTGSDTSVFEAFGALPADTEAFGALPADADKSSPHCVRAAQKETKRPAVFVAGDANLGSTLVVNAIADGLACTKELIATFKNAH